MKIIEEMVEELERLTQALAREKVIAAIVGDISKNQGESIERLTKDLLMSDNRREDLRAKVNDLTHENATITSRLQASEAREQGLRSDLETTILLLETKVIPSCSYQANKERGGDPGMCGGWTNLTNMSQEQLTKLKKALSTPAPVDPWKPDCDCYKATPTYPTFRDNPHLPSCKFYNAPAPIDEELEGLRKDKERLDWLDKANGAFYLLRQAGANLKTLDLTGKDIFAAVSVRQAIDAASQKNKQTP